MVLPVPGGPEKIRCWLILGVGRPGRLSLAGGGEQVDQGRHLVLDRGQADHGVQFGEQFLGAGAVVGPGGGVVRDVLGQQQGQVALRRVRHDAEAVRLAVDHLLEHLAGGAAVAERGVARHPFVVPGERVQGAGVQFVAVARAHVLGDGHQLADRVVGELDGPGEAGGQTRVGGEEAAHLVGVAGGDDDDVVAVVLHQLEQGVDRLPAEVGAGALAVGHEGVRLVDEQHTAEGVVEGLGGLDRRTADDLGDEVGAGDLDEVSGAQDAEFGEDAAVEPGHGGLAGAGRAGEDQVAAHRRDGHAELGAALGELVEVDEGPYLVLDVGEADQGLQFRQRALRGGVALLPRRRGRRDVVRERVAPDVRGGVAGAVQVLDREPLARAGLLEAGAAVVAYGAAGHGDRLGAVDADAVADAAGDLAVGEGGPAAVGHQDAVRAAVGDVGAQDGQFAAVLDGEAGRRGRSPPGSPGGCRCPPRRRRRWSRRLRAGPCRVLRACRPRRCGVRRRPPGRSRSAPAARARPRRPRCRGRRDR